MFGVLEKVIRLWTTCRVLWIRYDRGRPCEELDSRESNKTVRILCAILHSLWIMNYHQILLKLARDKDCLSYATQWRTKISCLTCLYTLQRPIQSIQIPRWYFNFVLRFVDCRGYSFGEIPHETCWPGLLELAMSQIPGRLASVHLSDGSNQNLDIRDYNNCWQGLSTA